MALRPGKVFIVGLPRTGTTSLCVALLATRMKIAHNVYRQSTLEAADVVADTPVFTRYPDLDRAYPNSKFVYLDRDLDSWVPSIQRLLSNMVNHLDPAHGLFNTLVKDCYREIFGAISLDRIADGEYLRGCYARHQTELQRYFAERNNFFSLRLNNAGSANDLSEFLELDTPIEAFPLTNVGNEHTAWDQIVHANKLPPDPQSAIWQS